MKGTGHIKLYEHQKRALAGMGLHDVGKVIMPTGTGKTYVQASYISDRMKLQSCISDRIKESGSTPKVYVVVAPVIVLTYQLATEYNELFTSTGVFPNYLYVHSGTPGDVEALNEARAIYNEGNLDVSSGTNPLAIRKEINDSLDEGKSIVIFSTYKSLGRVETAVRLNSEGRRSVDCVIFDEAHNLVEEKPFEQMKKFKKLCEKVFFFTATEKHTKHGPLGMNNEEVYGSGAFTMQASEAIQTGFSVRPRAHILTSDNDEYTSKDLEKSISSITYKAVKEHEKALAIEAKESDLERPPRAAKLLVTTKGSAYIEETLASKEIQSLIDEGYEIFAISSEYGAVINRIDNVFDRVEWLQDLKKKCKDPEQKLVVLHIDILAEGIDASGFTGVLLFRGVGKSKFLQTFGRISRLDNRDRQNIHVEKTITPSELGKMYKPFAYVMFVELTDGSKEMSSRFKEYIDILRTLGMDSRDYIVGNIKGKKNTDPPEDGLLVNPAVAPGSNLTSKYGKIIKDLLAELEAAEDASCLLDKLSEPAPASSLASAIWE